ncbi:hypothetical protein HHK36_014583 [Tetracentron sinense]|uniref:Uncharacterized protein n=1 Tax=Tetracentron sinense TaxID=13715 RepID=A0A834Z363_TETSI|nr:hypothetical protein HHK36_014583 [Tetracentron sinense]
MRDPEPDAFPKRSLLKNSDAPPLIEIYDGFRENISRSYYKWISSLETIAKVRTCVVMLDLKCDALVLKMFQNFLKSMRQVLLQHEPGWASGILWKKEKYERDQVVLVANSLPALELPEIVVEAVKDCVKAQ